MSGITKSGITCQQRKGINNYSALEFRSYVIAIIHQLFVATNCFTLQVKEATIRGRLLNEGGRLLIDQQ